MEDFTIKEGAIGVHELFLNLQEAGFSRAEALWLCACIMKGVPLPEKFIKMIEKGLE